MLLRAGQATPPSALSMMRAWMQAKVTDRKILPVRGCPGSFANSLNANFWRQLKERRATARRPGNGDCKVAALFSVAGRDL